MSSIEFTNSLCDYKFNNLPSLLCFFSVRSFQSARCPVGRGKLLYSSTCSQDQSQRAFEQIMRPHFMQVQYQSYGPPHQLSPPPTNATSSRRLGSAYCEKAVCTEATRSPLRVVMPPLSHNGQNVRVRIAAISPRSKVTKTP